MFDGSPQSEYIRCNGKQVLPHICYRISSHMYIFQSRLRDTINQTTGSKDLVQKKHNRRCADLDGDLGFPGCTGDDVSGDAFKDLSKCTTSEELCQCQLVAVEVRQSRNVLICRNDAVNRNKGALLVVISDTAFVKKIHHFTMSIFIILFTLNWSNHPQGSTSCVSHQPLKCPGKFDECKHG